MTSELVGALANSCTQELDVAWDRLRTLVDMDSPPEDVTCLDRVVQLVGSWWEETGFDVATLRTERGLPVIRAERQGRPGAPVVLLMFHLDTVFPVGTTDSRGFTLAEGLARGPGVADMKSGLLVGLLAVRAAIRSERGLDAITVRVLCNTDEEADSAESRALLTDAARDASLALVFEPARPDGSVVVSRHGVRRYRITVRGKAAHAGVDPWNGVNAIGELARKVGLLHRLNDRARGTSVTVSLINGGTRVNVVPDEATAHVDVRVPDNEAADRVHADIEKVVADAGNGAETSYALVANRPPLTTQPEVERYLNVVRAAGRHLGLDIGSTSTGGGGDGAFPSVLGVPTLDGLWAVGGGYHTAGEFIVAASLKERAVVAGCLLLACCAGASTLQTHRTE